MKHTKGPWKWAYLKTYGGRLIGLYGVNIIEYAEHEGMWFATYDDEINQANANLIAAAPELYEALETVINDVEPTEFALSSRVRNMIDTALKKARGETEQ